MFFTQKVFIATTTTTTVNILIEFYTDETYHPSSYTQTQ